MQFFQEASSLFSANVEVSYGETAEPFAINFTDLLESWLISYGNSVGACSFATQYSRLLNLVSIPTGCPKNLESPRNGRERKSSNPVQSAV